MPYPNLSLDITFVCICIFLFLLFRYVWQDPDKTAAMKRFIDKAKSAMSKDDHQQPLQPDRPSSVQPPTSADMTRYRYHHGCNLGSVFVLEKWLTGSMFPDDAQGFSELTAAQAWVKQEGIDKARVRFQRHWAEYVSDTDLAWLRDVAKCTTVRLPMGFFTLGPPYCEGTPFKQVAGVYQNAWSAYRELVKRCHDHGIGTLIDFHALPGGANGGDHSGTNSGRAELWGSKGNLDLATRCLCFVAQQARYMEGVVGIQIDNEAEYDAKGLYDWYDRTLQELSRIDPSIPIYVSDGWDLNRALSWSQPHNSLRNAQCNPIVIDTHLYWCFSDADKAKSPQQITSEVAGKLSELDGKDGSVGDHGAAQTIIGEYSCVLDGQSWAKSQGAPKDDLVHQFGNAQSKRWQERAGGSYFWTGKMDWMPGGEWGFRQMMEQHAIVPPASLTLPAADVKQRVQSAQQHYQQRRQSAVSQHVHYWDSNHPGTCEHWRFEQGWDLGWNDAMAFFGMRSQQGLEGADKIGMLDLWCLKRLRESRQGGKFMWEFEQGLRQGVKDFGECMGV